MDEYLHKPSQGWNAIKEPLQEAINCWGTVPAQSVGQITSAARAPVLRGTFGLVGLLLKLEALGQNFIGARSRGQHRLQGLFKVSLVIAERVHEGSGLLDQTGRVGGFRSGVPL